MDPVIATPCRVHADDDPVGEAVLGHPFDQLHGAVRAVAPAERLVVLGERAGREQLAVIAAVDDLVDVAERDVLPGTPSSSSRRDLLEGARAALAVGEDRAAGPVVRRGRRLEDRRSRADGPPSLPATLITPAR